MLNKKQIISLITLISLVCINVSAEYYYENKYDNGYKDAIIDNDIKFEAYRDGSSVKMKWESYDDSDFMYYKIMRSETNENPVYPDQPAIKYMDNSEIEEYKINNYSSKEATYRICVITNQKDRYCSNTVKLEGYEKEQNKNYKYEEKEYHEENKYNDNYKMNKKADLIVNNFIEKIEKKYENNSDRKKVIENVIDKLESLAEKEEKYKDLVKYLNMKLKSKLAKYDDLFEEIEEIFEIE